jgi:glutamate carboxypeptidase
MTLPSSIAGLSGRTAELVALLIAWSEINSGSSNRAGLDRMRAALRIEFSRIPGAEVADVPLGEDSAAGLSVTMRRDAPIRILLSGHLDTVYKPEDPFQHCRWLDDQRLNGPGVADMKGGIVTLLATLQAFEQTPDAGKLGWEVLLTPDEETGSRASAPAIAEAARRAQFGLVFEPARPTGEIVRSRKGTGILVATCRGRAAHAAKVPNDGRNAILALAEFLIAASRIPTEIPGALVNVGNIRGGSFATNVVPDFAQAEIDLRITSVSDREPLLARFEALAAGINAREGFVLELKGGFNRPPKECVPAEEKVFAQWQHAARAVGVAPFDWVHAGGGSDGNLLSAAGLPNLDGVGPIGDHLHSSREYVDVSSIVARAQIAALWLHWVAAGTASLGR